MSDILRVQPFDLLLRRMLVEYEHSRSIFGIHESLWHKPRTDAPYATPGFFGKRLSTPIGPSAGPHTQLSQNIIAAWLCGGHFIELKTVQIMDELVIPRPCIDMEDEGYNVEWSQELKLEESAQEYINAWAAIHVLRRAAGVGRDAVRPSAELRHLRHERGLQPGRHQDPAHDPLHEPDGRRLRGARRDPGHPESAVPPICQSTDPCPTHQLRHPLHDARLPARRDRAHRPVSAGGARAAHRRQDEPDAAGQRPRAEHPARRSRLHRSPHPGLGLRERPEVRDGAGVDPQDAGIRRRPEPDLRREAEQHAGDAQPQDADAGRRDVHVGPGALSGHDEPVQQAGARVQRRLARILLRRRGRAEHRDDPLVRRAAGDGVLRPAEAGRLRAVRAMAGKRRGGDAGQRR